jgi:hypothetical protein
MTRFRKWLLTASITLALLFPLASVASADPLDPGMFLTGTTGSSTTKGGGGRSLLDPLDPSGG